ncbi:MAG: hypothetical protein FJW56_06715 [Actinobacteria bacterium]|nr:hypothetical protein [Actinomycetota bacterium]
MKKIFICAFLLSLILSSCSKQTISDDQIIADLVGKRVGNYNYKALQEIVDKKIKLKNESNNIKEYEVFLILKELETNRYYFHHFLQTYILKDDKFEFGQNTQLHFFRDFPFKKLELINYKSGNNSWSGQIRFGYINKKAAIVVNGKNDENKMSGYLALDNDIIEISEIDPASRALEKGKWNYLYEGYSKEYGGVTILANEETVATDTWELVGELSTDLASNYCCGKFSLSSTIDAFKMHELFYDNEKSILK